MEDVPGLLIEEHDIVKIEHLNAAISRLIKAMTPPYQRLDAITRPQALSPGAVLANWQHFADRNNDDEFDDEDDEDDDVDADDADDHDDYADYLSGAYIVPQGLQFTDRVKLEI